MRTYILTMAERSQIQIYFKTQEATPHLILTKSRAKKYLPRLLEDLKLIEALLTHSSAPKAKKDWGTNPMSCGSEG